MHGSMNIKFTKLDIGFIGRKRNKY